MDSQPTDHHSARPTGTCPTGTCPTMTWVEVTDAAGRTRLEARWSAPGHAIASPHAA